MHGVSPGKAYAHVEEIREQLFSGQNNKIANIKVEYQGERNKR